MHIDARWCNKYYYSAGPFGPLTGHLLQIVDVDVWSRVFPNDRTTIRLWMWSIECIQAVDVGLLASPPWLMGGGGDDYSILRDYYVTLLKTMIYALICVLQYKWRTISMFLNNFTSPQKAELPFPGGKFNSRRNQPTAGYVPDPIV